jgi:hypothetical protein
MTFQEKTLSLRRPIPIQGAVEKQAPDAYDPSRMS